MKKIKLNLLSIQVKNFMTIVTHNYAHKPAIKFLGKRSLIHPQKHIVTHENIQITKSYNFTKESLSVEPTSTIKFRSPLTAEEISFINTGGPLVIPDWTRVKLRGKKQT